MRKFFIATSIILTMALAIFGRTQQPEMKGYELYSWKVNGKWHYSLVSGTNRIKSFEEITTNKNIKIGESALKDELKKLPKGEEVFWMSDDPGKISRPVTGSSSTMKLPSRSRIKELIAYCDKLGIKLTLH